MVDREENGVEFFAIQFDDASVTETTHFTFNCMSIKLPFIDPFFLKRILLISAERKVNHIYIMSFT